MIEVVHGQETHKYLGKKLPGDLSARATVDVKHRIHIAWMKFNQWWVPVVNGDWHDAMSRMNQKLQNAYRIYPTKSWPEDSDRQIPFCGKDRM